MKITILCSSEEHPVNAYLRNWIDGVSKAHDVDLVRKKSDLDFGDLLFLISCSELIDQKTRKKYKKVLIIHASDLPDGRGWSPHIWQILEGKKEIIVTLLEAEDKVDSGDIWHKLSVIIPDHYLSDEINHALFVTEIKLMDFAIKNFYKVNIKQQCVKSNLTYYSKRSPSDSEVDVTETFESQFDLIRVCDSNRFPAFLKHRGHKYKILLEKIIDE